MATTNSNVDTTTAPAAPAGPHDATGAPGTLPLPHKTARLLTLTGAVTTFASTMLAWTWTAEFPGDLTYYGSPVDLQTLTLVGSLLTIALLLSGSGVRGLRWLTPGGRTAPVVLASLGTLGVAWFSAGAIAVVLGGLVNFEAGMWVAVAGSLLAVVGALGLKADEPFDPSDPTLRNPGAWRRFRHSLKAAAPAPGKELPGWAELLIIAVTFGIGLYVFTYGIDTPYGELFIGFLILVGFGATALGRAGLNQRLGKLTAKHRNVTFTAAFVAAACFPFTQSSDQYTSVAANILIFATVALGLNVVVGLAGLLDLGYVAFLGVGAYAAALVSGSETSVLGVHFPFWAAVLTGAGASLVFGVVIGAPTLRLHGDYLAIVTLGFGEIFRIGMENLDGSSGPSVTNGANGIANIPDLVIFGFNLGEDHTIAGFELGPFANYYLLMLLFTIIIVTIFRRADRSRIGRAWVAVREDETAARAMGINGFRVKLIAFALGATLAGMAGTVQAHVTSSVTPEQYQFVEVVPPNSAFLLAAVILGGMGTVSGPLIGASLLYLIPAKLQFIGEYQLLLFGLALILLMRFRPEGLLADRRKKLEFKETGQLDVPTGGPGLSKTEA
ncbi:branched-chain amino acid transport system permease protein [Streptomyces sp. WMMB 714]|uniref:branched-chain amino acid ABC transporter permease n=1 Tax=Streptomyces sp. WMMB 714 TaxID=1286822 RepID=UPI0006965085|nr:branched-chain amino acid ABC transporter permease [Streptomyces sp. WMMB 714]SCK29402.1 branched-chain amino acid transport system permease protein [Streptomyces sp. WMMB 714]